MSSVAVNCYMSHCAERTQRRPSNSTRRRCKNINANTLVGPLLPTPRRWRSTDQLLKRAAKCGLGLVTDVLGNRGDIGRTTGEQPRCDLHAPVREIVHRRLTNK